MGLREAWQRFNTPVFDWKSRKNLMRWTEPQYSRVRLKGDMGQRLLIVVGICLLLCGTFAFIFASNSHRPSLALALAMGSFFGLLLGGLVLFPRKKETGGNIIIAPECIQRQRFLVGLSYTIETDTWPFSAIDHCVIVPNTEIGLNFSLLQLSIKGTTEFVTVPAKIKLVDLAQILVEQGVRVTKGQSVPSEMKRPTYQTLGWGVLLAGGLVFLSGLAYFAFVRIGAPHNRLGQLAQQPAAPRYVPRIPPNPARAAPLPPQPPTFMPSHPVPPTPPRPFAAQSDASQATIPANPFDAAPENPFGAAPAGSSTSGASSLPEDTAENPFDASPVTPSADAEENPFEMQPVPAASDADTREAAGKSSTQTDASASADEDNPFASRASAQSTTPPAASDLKTTRFVGSEEGTTTALIDPERRPLLGLRCTFKTDAEGTRCVDIETLHTRDGGAAPKGAVMARDGYAVLALRIRTTNHITGLQIAFARVGPDGQLDPQDTYISDWQGDASGGSLETLNGASKKVLGLELRRASNLVTALALVLE
jgi:hypothetical protein